MIEKSEKQVKIEKPLVSSDVSMPMAASIKEILRAVKILSDHGGKARWGEIGSSFGTKASEKNMLNWALNAAVAFDLILPHGKGAAYVLSEDGTKFNSLQENQQKAMLLEKFLRFEGYRLILVAMKNNQEKALKKSNITEMWSQVRNNTKLNTRKSNTTTFASVGEWSEALVDSGQSCSLRPEAERVFEQILRGGEQGQTNVNPKPSVEEKPIDSPKGSEWTGLLVTSCLHCGKTDIGVENEELLQTLPGNGSHTLIIKNTYFCKGCSRTFSRIDQRILKTDN
jgi:hypothetical protein